MRIAHLSDPHFSCVTYSPWQFFTKRWIGNFNLIFFRKKAYQTEHLWYLPKLLCSLKTEAVFITGDFSSTSLDEEFTLGKKFLYAFKEQGLSTFFVPGNHDCYIRSIQKKRRFYTFFQSMALQEKRVEKISLGKNWWYIGLDCAVVSPPFCSYGHFLKQTEEYLQQLLLSIPASDSVIVANHFPLFATCHPLHDLKRSERLQEILKNFSQVKLYLHGHDHNPYVVDRQKEGLPLVLNSGSCAHRPNGTFYLIDLFEKSCLVQRLLFRKSDQKFTWAIHWQKHYEFRS